MAISQIIEERSINITSILNNFKFLIAQVYEKGYAPINLPRKLIKISTLEQIQHKGRKTTYTERRKADLFLIIAKINIFLKLKYYKSKTDTLYQLNVYAKPAKEYQVVDR